MQVTVNLRLPKRLLHAPLYIKENCYFILLTRMKDHLRTLPYYHQLYSKLNTNAVFYCNCLDTQNNTHYCCINNNEKFAIYSV